MKRLLLVLLALTMGTSVSMRVPQLPPISYVGYPAHELLHVNPENVLQYIRTKTKQLGNEQAVVQQLVTHFAGDGNMPVLQAMYRQYGRQYPGLFVGKGCINYVKSAVVRDYARGTLGHIQRRATVVGEMTAVYQAVRYIARGNIHGVWTCDQKWRVLEVIMKRYAKQHSECILEAVLVFEKDACLQEVVEYLHKHKLLGTCPQATLQRARQSAVSQFLPCRTFLGEPELYWSGPGRMQPQFVHQGQADVCIVS